MTVCRLLFALTLVISSLNSGPSHAEPPQKSDSGILDSQTESHELNAQLGKDVAAETLAGIERLRQQAKDADQLAPEAKAEVVDLCDKSVAKLDEAAKLEVATLKLQQELETSASTLAALQSKDSQDQPEELPSTGVSSEEMLSRLLTAGQIVTVARDKLQSTTSEIQRRTERRKSLPELLANCREQLTSVMETQKQPAVDQPALLTDARKHYLIARRIYRGKELKSLEQENRTYEATSRLWQSIRDDREKKLQVATEQYQAIEKSAGAMQRQDAERQAQEARRSAINVHPAIKEAAAINADLAERNQKIVARIQTVKQSLAEANELGQSVGERLADVTKRAEAANYAPITGVMLRNQQDQLPALGPYRHSLQKRTRETSKLSLDIYDWESQRREAIQVEKAIQSAQRAFAVSESEVMPEAVAAELRRVLEARPNVLAELYSNSDDCLSRLGELDAAEIKVIAITEQLKSFIAEHVLWVRSARRLSLSELQRATSDPEDWKGIVEQAKSVASSLLSDIRQNSFWWGLAAILIAVLVVGRGRIRNELKASGDAAEKPTATSFRPTVDAAIATILLAAPIPLLTAFLGWRLCQANDDLLHALGWELVLTSFVFTILELVRHTCRSDGLGTSHFGWNPERQQAIRCSSRTLQLLALPLLAIAVGIEGVHGKGILSTVGRLSLITALLIVGFVCFRLLRASQPLVFSSAARADGSIQTRTLEKVIISLSMLAIAGMILASAAGFHYTAVELTRRVFASCVFVFACVALRSLLMRWLLVAYRRATMRQAQEERRAQLEPKSGNSAETHVIEAEQQVSLSNINQQAGKLVGVGAALAFMATMWFVWSDILPALGIFSRVELWASGLASLNPDAGIDFITLSDLMIAVAIFAFTWFAGSNLPGLLEIAVLQKLPLDAGARYAASSVARYTIVVVGTALCIRQLGVGWQNVQWLVAAMTVGLGFGLQEIFANFVSGIILLFERPARVGDTVTVGTITGTVTKIRIRATTILDWDNKELIVPNKEFVTGNLVNWTLSNPSLRLILKVGVAYGSDTRLVTKLLYKVANESPHVLMTPEPSVIFDEFGDSSLNFELRLFVTDLNLYRRLRHELNLAIDDLFREHQVEIAFPQCDLHVKSMPEAAQTSLKIHQPIETTNAKEAAA